MTCRAWGDIRNAMASTTDPTVAAPAGLRFSSASLNSAPYRGQGLGHLGVEPAGGDPTARRGRVRGRAL